MLRNNLETGKDSDRADFRNAKPSQSHHKYALSWDYGYGCYQRDQFGTRQEKHARILARKWINL